MPTGMPTDPPDSEACAYTEYRDGETPDAYPKTGADATGVERAVWDAIREVQDPEMPVSVVELGLIYGVEVDPDAGTATVVMTLTYSGCPARDILTNDVRCAAETVPAIDECDVRLQYTPEWNVNMVTERGRDALREFGLSV